MPAKVRMAAVCFASEEERAELEKLKGDMSWSNFFRIGRGLKPLEVRISDGLRKLNKKRQREAKKKSKKY